MRKGLPLLLTVLWLLSPLSHGAPASKYWSFWDKSNEKSVETVDHSAWSSFLDQYLVVTSHGNLVDYGKVSKAHRAFLRQYINSLTEIDPREYAKPEQMAYWINLYNALTVDLIG